MALVPESVMRDRILVVLSAYESGSRSRAQVLDDLDEAFHDEWSAEDLQPREARPWEPAWKNQASRARQHMVTDGLLVPSGDGNWTLTDAGWAASTSLGAGSQSSVKPAVGQVVQAVAEGRAEARNYRVEATEPILLGREFWFTTEDGDGHCVYAKDALALAIVREIRDGSAPVDGLRRSEQPPGVFQTLVSATEPTRHVARLSELTDPSAVQRALDEFVSLGRDEFLSRDGLERSRDYFVYQGGVLADSKPILAVAYRHQYADRGLLPVANFSGGVAGAVRALRRLGYEVVTRAQLRPPQLGQQYASRTAVYEDGYGGDKVAGVIRFPGDEVVNVFSDAQGPYSDDPPTLSEPFGYRGEGLVGPQRLSAGGNALLEGARESGDAARFWYRPRGEPFTFLTWVAVLGRAWVDGVGQDGVPRPELEWRLQAVPDPDPARWPEEVLATRAESEDTVEDDPTVPEAQPSSSYSELVDRVEKQGQDKRPSGIVRANYARSVAARRAVLVRCDGQCESPRCTGMPAEVNRRGQPILDVDHIQDLALGGEDHPRNMVALCPNCHACKTRGKETAQWRRELRAVAEKAHLASMSGAA